MKNRFLLRGISILGLAFAIAWSSAFAQMPKRKVLVEKTTGAWCQYCPSGITAVKQMETQFPDDVIAVAIHQGDGMAIPEAQTLQQESQNGFWGGGVPAAAANRQIFATHPSTLAGQIGGYISSNRTSIVEVRFKSVSYNASTRNVTIDVEARFYGNHNGEKRFNLYVVEDSVTGSGSQFDQVNAYNSQQGSEWYGKGNPIKNFPHRHVARRMLGGAWGTAGSIPANVQAGQIVTYKYTTKIENTWKPERISLVASVNEYTAGWNTRQIMNSEEEHLMIRSAKADIAYDKPYNIIKPSTPIEKTITVKNTNAMELTYDLAIDENGSQYPWDWTVEVDPSTLTIGSGQSKTAMLKITPGASFETAALGSVEVSVVPQATPGIIPKGNSAKVFALTDNAKYVVYSNYQAENWVDDYVSNLTVSELWGQGIVKLPYSQDIASAYSSQFDAAVFVITGGFFTQPQPVNNGYPLAMTSGDYPNFAKIIADMLAAGKGVFVSAPHSLSWALDSDPKWVNGKNTDAINLFQNIMKVDLAKSEQRYTAVQNGNQIQYGLKDFNFNGMANDVISDAISGRANTGFSQCTFWTDIMRVKVGSKSVPIFTADNVATNVVGIRLENDAKGRLVFLTCPPEAFQALVTRQMILERSFSWLLEGKIVKPKKALISSTISTVDFKDVVMGQSKDMSVEIGNGGDTTLVISAVTLEGINPEAFAFVDMPTLPVSVEPGQKQMFSLKFTPDAVKNYVAVMAIVSNSGGDPQSTLSLDLQGKGISDAPKPSVLSIGSGKIEFGTVSTKTEKTITITNTANQAIEIKSVKFEGKNADLFMVENLSAGAVIPQGQKLPIKVVFDASASGSYAATLVLNSTLDDMTDDLFTAEVTGSFIPSSVEEDAVSATLSVSVGPNPAASHSVATYVVGGSAPRHVKATMIDANGRLVATLAEGMVQPGSQTLALPVQNLAGGAYRVVIVAGNERVSAPLIINR